MQCKLVRMRYTSLYTDLPSTSLVHPTLSYPTISYIFRRLFQPVASYHIPSHRLVLYLSAGVGKTTDVPKPPVPLAPPCDDVISDSSSSAISPRVCLSTMEGIGITTPMSFRRYADSFARRRECPPRSKKSDETWIVSSSTLSRRAHSCATDLRAAERL